MKKIPPPKASLPARQQEETNPPVLPSEPITSKPLKWYGGKHYLAQRIVAMMPPHKHYVEPYAGGLSVLFAKPRIASEVVNDLHGELTNFWRVLQDVNKFERFRRQVEAVPFSEVEWDAAGLPPSREKDAESLAVQRAVKFFIRYRQSRTGAGLDFNDLSKVRTRRGMNEQAASWITAVEGLPQVHRRLRGVVIFNKKALAVIREQDSPHTLFYLDPPYLGTSRVDDKVYDHEMSLQDHHDLLGLLPSLQGKWILSGYPSRVYDVWQNTHSFWRHDIKVKDNASGQKTKPERTECLWTNFLPTIPLK